jgi:hypothetical protein
MQFGQEGGPGSTPQPEVPPAVRLYRELEPHLTTDRLGSYRRTSGGNDPERIILARYLLNLGLCEALYPALHILEVVLRNAICRAAAVRWPGTGALGGTGRLDCWLDWEPARSPLLPVHQRMVSEAKLELERNGYPPLEGRLIAALPFGFWTGMFSGHYGDPMPSEPRLWPSLFPVAFANLPSHWQHRSNLADRLRAIRHLRNRAFHHEPIWTRKVRLDELQIREVIGWICPAAERLVGEASRLASVVQKSMVPHEHAVKRLAGD